MLTISPGSSCDVCAEEYGPRCQPHSIPCGHVLCARCCSTIVEKTSVRLAPVCPFCREQFSSDSIRLIRMDYSGSGWSTPRRKGGTIEANIHADLTSDLLAKHTERLMTLDSEGGSKTRAEARRLESKVAKVAAKKCSVEEVTTLHKELQEWLTSDVKPDDQTSSLFLSAALLRAILMNHIAHSEASKLSKSIEANLKGKLDHLESTNERLETELRRERAQREIKAQECQHLRTELSQLKALTSTLGFPSPITSPEPTSPSPSPLPSMTSTSSMTHTTHSHTNTTSTPSTPYSPTSPTSTHVARFNSLHARSVSASGSSRPTTPSSIPRSHTPSPHGHPRSHTPGPTSSASVAARSHTPSPRVAQGVPSGRSYTPSLRSGTPVAHAFPHGMSHAHSTSSASHYRSQTPAAPGHGQSPQTPNQQIMPSRPRRLSLSAASPQKLMRSISDEKHDAHERWIPLADPDSPSAPTARPASAFTPMRMMSNAARSMSSAAAAAARYRAARSPSPHNN
ncbi:hypothetical protein HGRIS_014287 [Hohenbuehelia grisea]|uniref:RING-type domain-containing protein n=1 Tax=Hohenbuehelia grisea TaxID=104357 RepID=A0ABR3JUX2_9AGAR